MPRATPPNLDGLRPNERAEVMVKYQIENEMPTGLRQIAIYRDGVTYDEDSIRRFGTFLAYMIEKDTEPERVYRIKFAHRGGDEYEIVSSSVPDHEEEPVPPITPEGAFRRLWEYHASLDEYWVRFRKEFGETALAEAIDRAMERQEMREAGEVD
jgi:hypothetical protein